MPVLSDKKIEQLWKKPTFTGSYSGAHTFYKELQRSTQKSDLPTYKRVLSVLQKIPTYQIHASYRDRAKLLHVTNIDGVGLQLHMDLAFMPTYNEYKGFLLAIDPWNNFVRTVPIKTKTGAETKKCILLLMEDRKSVV